MIRVRSFALGLLFAVAVPAAAQAPGLEGAIEAWRAGDYDAAETTLRSLTRREGASAEALRAHARLLIERGRADAALTLLAGDETVAVETVRGEAFLARGRWTDAEQAFRRVVENGGTEASLARLHLGELLLKRGHRDEAAGLFDGFIDFYNRGSARTATDLLAVGRAVAHLGRSNPVLFQDALRALDEAAAADPGDARVQVAIGELFLSRYNSPEAHDAFNQVLARNPRHPDALLGRARAREFDGVGDPLEPVTRALETNPEHAEARAFLARLHLKTEDPSVTRTEAERALRSNPNSLDALAVLAASYRLEGDMAGWERTRDRALALNPAFADLFVTAADLAVDYRKYHQAVELATEAVRRDSLAWEGWGLLGMNRLRIGDIEAGRAALERAFEGDPYNPWFKNNLDLLDTFGEYVTVETEHFHLFLHGDEAQVLAPYLAELAEEAYAALRERYGGEPPTPIRLEVFPRHADFSVRTLGLVGLGALGVSFGSTLVMDSPSARDIGDFNWASTFWHELAHAYHLGLTDHNVPRWFSEGLAVREQRVARPYWGHRVGPAFLNAYREGRMPTLTNLNEAFVRPAFPEQVVLAYTQASLVFDWIEEEWGFGAVRDLLAGYRAGHDTETLAERVLGLGGDALDGAFDRYVRTRFEGELRAIVPNAGPAVGADGVAGLRQAVRQRPSDFRARLALGTALTREGAHDEAEEHLEAALELFPGYGAPDGPLRQLATIREARGDLAGAADALRRLGGLGESLHQVHLDEAELRRRLGDDAGELAALARAVEIAPHQLDPHRRLADLADAAGRYGLAVRERRVVLALRPPDRADAHFRLANSLHRAGEVDEARTQVLRALEIAPGYEAALDLLLELRRGGGDR